MMLNAWTWACLLLTAGAPAQDVWHLNASKFQIPIRIAPGRRDEIKELKLFASRDKGETWELVGVATPDKDAFTYFAPGDGIYWFSVAVVDAKGQQEPRDVKQGPIGQKIVVDTNKPEVKINVAERQGDDVLLRWEARDANVDAATLQVEFKNDANGGVWTPVQTTAGVSGQASFRAGSGPVTVRVTVKDLAGNQGQALQDVGAGRSVPLPALAGGPSTPIPTPTPNATPTPTPIPMPTPAVSSGSSPIPSPVPVSNWTGSTTTSLIPSTTNTTPPPLDPIDPVPPRPAPTTGSGTRSIALSASTPPAISSDALAPLPRTMPPARGALAGLQVVNKRQVKLDFEVNKFGPSGLGGVDVYVTTDEGQTWDKMPGDPNVLLPGGEQRSGSPVKGSVAVPLSREATIYGFHLVVKSRAGLGKPPPQRGDQPQLRVELDATLPEAELYSPQADPARRDTLLLSWKASDRNLSPEPITLEWAERRDGPWQPIGGSQLPNTGRHSWQVPANAPPSVFLKLSVRDTAGNIAVAQTSEPILVDLTVPEVSAISLSGAK